MAKKELEINLNPDGAAAKAWLDEQPATEEKEIAFTDANGQRVVYVYQEKEKKSAPMTLLLTKKLSDKVKKGAKARGMSVNSFVSFLLEVALENEGAEHGKN